ncbi:hypothetical protein M2302_002259 [Micromonospora sp. A200]|uniref:hypothetical protein n=1 Tax=Micromonospora sp. A200 TaxID=2940568 RepID=UPI0024749F15|nr:hypothetical protein [Micromonospora sp. A200]MDH6462084.1 hypothetical protein [Micromonospora sp. A200]
MTMTKTRTRSAERIEFLDGLLVTAIENYGYGWFLVHEYEGEGADAYAVIEPEDEPGTKHRVDIDTMAKGLGVIRRAVMRETERDGEVLHNAETGERLYMGRALRKDILDADRTNGDEGDIDVVGALAVLECALFGQVVYA